MLEKELVTKHRVPDTREEWLKDRMAGIGGSDAGTILGFNRYKSAYSLWAEKTGLITPPDVDNEAMRVGRDLEDYVAHRFMEITGKKVRKSSFSYKSNEHPYMLANVDRLIVGEDAGLECKTASALTRVRYDKGNIPESYYAQCVHYMAVTGAKCWYIAVLVMGRGFYWWKVERDEEEINSLIVEEKLFWDLVQTKQPPEIDGSESTEETLKMLYPDADLESDVDCTLVETHVEALVDVNEQINKLTAAKKTLENQIKGFLEESCYGHTREYKITYKPTKPRVTVDSKKLQNEYPAVYDAVLKTGKPTRPFKLEKLKKED